VDDWYDYREQTFREIAIALLESNSIAYTDEETPSTGKMLDRN
jgi:hypothetical protein